MAGDSGSLRKKLTEFWEAICGGAEKKRGRMDRQWRRKIRKSDLE
jgi:hypothetical protein